MADPSCGDSENHSIGQTDPLFSKSRVIKNLIVLSVVFLIIFTAYDCLGMLQSTLNHDGGIGVACQALVYGLFCFSSLLFPKYFIKRLGCKLTLLLSLCCYIPYILSNIYPHWSLMVPTAILNGLSASLLWGSQSTYLNEISVMYSAILLSHRRKSNLNMCMETSRVKEINSVQDVQGKRSEGTMHVGLFLVGDELQSGISSKEQHLQDNLPEKPSNDCHESFTPTEKADRTSSAACKTPSRKLVESTTARFFGIYGMAYLSTHMWSNMMSYFVLEKDAEQQGSSFNTSCVCGARFCNEYSDCFNHNLLTPSDQSRTFLTALCVSLAAVAVILLQVFLDDLDDRDGSVKFSMDLLMATSRQMKKKSQILLIPVTFYIGMMQGFYNGDFAVSYVGCAWGTYHVGLVSICYGGFCAMLSYLSGWSVKLMGRWPVFALAFAMHLSAHCLLLTWNPSAESPVMFFIIASLWGASLGVFWSQSRAMYGVLFRDEEEAAFSAFHFWYSLGFCLSLAYSNHFCTNVKIYILIFVVMMGMIGYVWVEVEERMLLNKCKK